MTEFTDPTAGEMLKILGVRVPPQPVAPQRNIEVNIIRFLDALTKAGWSSPASRAGGMKGLKETTLGRSLALDDAAFAKKLAATVIKKIIGPAAVAAAPLHPIEEHRLAIAESASQLDGSVHACSCLYFKISFSRISKDPIEPSLNDRLRNLIDALQAGMKMVLRTHDIAKEAGALDDILGMAITIASICAGPGVRDRDNALSILADETASVLKNSGRAAARAEFLAA